MGVFAILSISLNLEAGFTKLMNFGKVAFFAVGAYTSALLTLNGAPYLVALVAAIALSSFAGFLIALPTLRLREDYFAIVTIAFGEILRIFLESEAWLTRGFLGLAGIPRPLRELFTANYLAFYSLYVAGMVLLCYLIARRVVNSPFGRVLKAIREDETAAQALGKDVFAFKTRSLIIGSGMAGLAGNLFAHHITFIAPEMFLPTLTFTVWIMMVIGGSGNLLGSIFGAVVIQAFERASFFIKELPLVPIEPLNFRIIVIGLLLVLFVLYRPEGILKERKAETVLVTIRSEEEGG
jgi:branched-chain amino acid transport system permease protein